MHILLRNLGQHRGAPRLYLDTPALADAGFRPGSGIAMSLAADEHRLTIRTDAGSTRRVSRKQRGERELPVIDLNNRDLAPFAGGVVRIVILAGVIHVLLPASVAKAAARRARLAAKLATGQPLATAGVAFGAGIASGAIHDGLAAGGVDAQLLLANEICERYVELAAERNPVVRPGTVVAAVPMQELAQDDWLLRRLPPIDLLEAGIPCSGASKAGVSKRKLAQMEDHPMVGHLMGALLQVVGALQPAIVVVENVESYRHTGSAAILRGWLRDAGYAIAEVVLDASDFGSLEARIRWFLVAHPPELRLDLEGLAPREPRRPQLAEVLDPIDPDDERWRHVHYLEAKQQRDAAKGNHFAMQVLSPHSDSVPVLRKGYHKGGSTDPRLVHPTDPSRSRLLTGMEHARIKGIDTALVEGLPTTVAHEVCGQAVDVRPVRSIGERIARAIRAWVAGTAETASVRRTNYLASVEAVG